MARKRKNPADAWLPARTYRGRKSYEYHPKSGGSVRLMKIKFDAAGNPIETAEIKRKVIQLQLEAEEKLVKREDMAWLFDTYIDSLQFRRLAKKTRDDDMIRLPRLRAVFGQMYPHSVTPGHIRLYMDKRGESAPVSANRDHGFLSRVFNWARERNITKENPADVVKKFPETARDRYIEDWEYWLVYETALTTAYPWIAPMMEVSYLCRMRKSEVTGLTEDKLLDNGIFVERGKGSKNEITLWSDRLQKAIKDGRRYCQGRDVVGLDLIFKNKAGTNISESGFNSAWQRVRDKAMTEGLEIDGQIIKLKESFTFHDIKAKGVTDHATKASGHRSKKMLAVYDRKPEIIGATR